MADLLHNYAFTHHIAIVNGRELHNFGEGDDVINTEYREDGITDTVGADGNMQVSASANRSATITFKFLAGAPENEYFEELYRKFLDGEIKGISVSIFNSITGKGEVSTTGYIPKMANNARGSNAQDREWVVVVPKLDIQKATR